MTEWVEIRATLHAMENKHLICGECQSTYKGRRDEEQMLARLKTSKACATQMQKPVHFIASDLAFKTCPGNYYAPYLSTWLEAHQAYQKGILPFPGTLVEQPNKVMEVFRMIDSHINEKTERELKKMQEKTKGARRGRQ